jgi:hypothetical protein
MIINFANDKTVEYLEALETEEYFNGASRRTLTFECAPNAIGIDELNTILSKESNLSSLTLVNEEANVSRIYDGYVLKLKVGIENKLVQAESADKPAIYEDRLVFKLGKRTYIEEQLKKLGL